MGEDHAMMTETPADRAHYRPEDVAGTCPACGELVFYPDETEGPVWTCPADLADTNPYAEPCLYEDKITEWEAKGYYGHCGAMWAGLPCYEDLPLHAECYERGNY